MHEIEFNLLVGSPTAPTPYKQISIRLPFRITGNPTPEDEDMVWSSIEDLACRLLRLMSQTVRSWNGEGPLASGAAEGLKEVIPDPQSNGGMSPDSSAFADT